MRNRTAIAIALLASLSLLVACGDGSETGSGNGSRGRTEDGAGGPDAPPDTGGVEVYLSQEIMVVLGGPPVRITHLVLRPDKVVYWGLPAGGVDGMEVEAIRADRPDLLGTWEKRDGTLRVTWPEEPEEEQNWDLETEGTGWRRDATRLYERVEALAAAALEGTWVAEESASVGLTGDVETIVSRTSRMTFHADGRFESGTSSGVSRTEGSPYEGDATDVAGAGSRGVSGTFSVRGFTLSLRDEDGSTRRLTLYRWAGDDRSIGIDGRRFQRE